MNHLSLCLKKITVLHCIDTYGDLHTRALGGAETIFVNLINKLDKAKFNSIILLAGYGALYEKLKEIGFNAHVIKAVGSMRLIYLLNLLYFIKTNGIDLIHSHLLGSSLYSGIAGLILGIPVIATFHGVMDVDSKDTFLKSKLKIINLGAKKIVFVSNYLRKYFETNFKIAMKKCSTIYNGVNYDEDLMENKSCLRKKFGFSERDILIGSIGNIRKAKGYNVLLKAASIVRKRYPDCFFVVAGEGKGDYFNELLSEREKLGLEKFVRFIGFEEDVYAFLQMIEIFVLSSRTEGFSLATIEAMNAGVPVVVTKSGGPQEIVVNDENGILVDVGDEIALANGIIRLIEDEVFRDKLVLEARKTILERFLLSTMIEKYETLYSEVSRKG